MKRGFTLAEVLITLGIVGVVAVLTLPNMMKNHQKRVLVTQLQRTYNTVINAMPSYMDEVQATSLFDTDAFNANRNSEDPSGLVSFIKENFKTSKICTSSTTGGVAACKGNEYRSIDGSEAHDFTGEACTILKTGSTICFNRVSDKTKFIPVYIDVNGTQGPNVWGRDAFKLEFNNAGDMSESFKDDPESTLPENCETNTYGRGCFNKIIADGWVMDY